MSATYDLWVDAAINGGGAGGGHSVPGRKAEAVAGVCLRAYYHEPNSPAANNLATDPSPWDLQGL